MNKQRFSVVYEEFTPKDIIPKGIMDNKKNNHMCRIEEVCGLLNEQQDQISYWKHKVNSLLWILSQFDKEKVKELLKEVGE